jgi:uncharacterized iron-regulated membrane protein
MKRQLRKVHKYLSLAVASLWLLQAVTGLLLVFHWEIDDAALAGPAHALDPAKLGRFLEQLQASHPQQSVTGVYPSGGAPGRFDVLIADRAGATDVLRVDGQGTVLRERPWNHDYLHIGWLQFATYLHQTLFLHTAGNWIIGLSGVLLLTNIGLGLSLAWARRGQWRLALTPPRAGPLAARIYGWHRAVGLWLAIPALLTICAGVVRAYDDPLADHFEDTRPAPTEAMAAREPARGDASIAAALRTALRLYPGSTLASLELPDEHAPWFTVKVNQLHDLRRISGTTTIYVSSRSGRLLADYDFRALPFRTRLWDAVYPFHTGEIGGVAGRILVSLIALWLITMIGLGVSMWLVRRRGRSSVAGRLQGTRPAIQDELR